MIDPILKPSDPHNIIPRGVHVATVRPLDLQVRTIVEYDIQYMRDRVRSDLFANGNPCGIYAAAVVDDRRFGDDRAGLEEAMRFHGPGLERMVVEEFMGHGYRKRVGELEYELQVLKAYVNRDRWWQFKPVRRRVRAAWIAQRKQLAARVAPKEDS